MALRQLLLLAILFISSATFAQTTEVFGKILDARTQEPLPYVSVKFNRVLQGVITDDNGVYRIRTSEKVDSIYFNFLGYKKVGKKVKHGKYQEINIEMEEGGIDLSEVTIKAKKKRKREIDTAANYVYYKVLENKDKNRLSNANTYQYEEYTKLLTSILNPPKWLVKLRIIKPFWFVFDNIDYTEDSSKYVPGLLKESLANVYYQKEPQKYKRIVTADEISGVQNESLNASIDYQTENLKTYDNLFVIAGKSFQSPFSPGALLLFHFHITDTAQLEGRTSYKFNFVAKNKADIALKGYAWIDSATWAIKIFKVRPNEKANINFIADYSIKQEYIYVKDQWVMKSENLQAVASLNKKKNLFSFLAQKQYERRNIKIDEPLPDTVFNGNSDVIFEDSAKTLARERLNAFRFIPLTPQEKNVYVFHDTFPKMRAYKQWYYTINTISTFMFRIPNINGPIEIGRIYKFVSRNNVEGWRLRLGGRTTKHFSEHLMFEGHVAYGLKDKELKYNGTVRIFPPSKTRKWNAIQFMYQYDMAVLGQENLIFTFDNVLSVFKSKPLQRVMKIRNANVQWEKDWINGFSTMMGMDKKTYYSIPGVFDFTKKRDLSNTIMHIPNYSTTELWVDFRYAHKEQSYTAFGYRYFQLGTKYPQLNFRVTGGVKGLLGGEYNYLKLNAMLNYRLSWAAGYTRFLVQTGYIYGKVPYPSSFVFSGSLTGFYYDKKSFNLMREFEFVADKYVNFWIEHHFDGFFLNKIPGIRKLQLREFVTFKALFGNFQHGNNREMIVPNDIKYIKWMPYIEAGFGFKNILKILRVDFVWRATYLNPTRGSYWKDFGSNWAVKFCISPSF